MRRLLGAAILVAAGCGRMTAPADARNISGTWASVSVPYVLPDSSKLVADEMTLGPDGQWSEMQAFQVLGHQVRAVFYNGTYVVENNQVQVTYEDGTFTLDVPDSDTLVERETFGTFVYKRK